LTVKFVPCDRTSEYENGHVYALKLVSLSRRGLLRLPTGAVTKTVGATTQ
jgi:hypothetical protein